MFQFFKRYRYFFLFFFLMSCGILVLFYNALKYRKSLPVYTPSMVNPEMVDSLIQHEANKQKHRIAPFTFINQNGDTITNKDYEGHIYVADFFFTTCPTICPIMGDNMEWLQEKIKAVPGVKLLSHTVTPDIDSVPVLKEYALKRGVDDAVWNLVTGDKRDIYFMARNSYLAVKTGSPDEMYDMVHTENFILVDSEGRIRGFYDGTNLNTKDPENKNMEELWEDIQWLYEHEKKSK
ncbi:SCO family protein [Myroides sp. 1354]|uniref:SCO family protein n=1 Tax=unclassified Myroides TaxID=2642485 RepID=UPI0025758773|nr:MULTISPECIES: SCO family protein [unclassified Myroides]MDM1043508.1 SCO family protein [Myroides sp. R163-1]MDM1054442.1 SCO family protein [Myroides sp. 1354]MDM1067738.1 SCO family protein [Myroides sp. 1372]